MRSNFRNVKLFAVLEFKELSDSLFNAKSEKENVYVPIVLSFDIGDSKFRNNDIVMIVGKHRTNFYLLSNVSKLN